MDIRRRKRDAEESINREAASDSDAVAAITSSSEAAADAVVGAAVRGGSLLMLLALIQRASTFVLNVLLQRAMLSADSPSRSDPDSNSGPTTTTTASSALEAYGAAAITLELISSTALFLAREPFRVALARSRVPSATTAAAAAAAAATATALGGDAGKRERERVGRRRREAYRRRFVNTAWVAAPAGVAFAAIVRLVYPWVIQNEAFGGIEENRKAASLVCLAAAVELLCEPLALIFQYRLLIDVRVKTEAAAVLVLGVSRYLLVTRAGMGVLSFGYAQLLHSAALATGYVAFAVRDTTSARAAAEVALSRPRVVSKVTQSGESPGESSTAAPGAAAEDAAGQGFASVRGWLPRGPILDSEGEGEGGGSWLDRGKLRLAGALAGQSLLKHVLTEGDKIVLARATSLGQGCGGTSNGVGCGQGGSLYEQGVYAIASGYGSLAARLLFQPLEEAARLMFSKLGSEEEGVSASSSSSSSSSSSQQGRIPPSPTEKASGGPATEGAQSPTAGEAGGRERKDGDRERIGGLRDGSAEDDSSRRLRERMAALLATLLKMVLTAGLVFVCFGFHYTETLLRLLLAGKGGGGGSGGSGAVSEVARVLSWYCVYVLFLAANGMCEAFACAVARGGQLTGMGGGLVASFGAFWALVGPLTGRFGTRGLVMANAAGMACRVACSAVFIRRFFLQGTTARRRRPVGSALPPPADGGGRRRDRNHERNLWREVVAGSIPHPAVVAAMCTSSAVAFAASPGSLSSRANGGGGGGVSWDAVGAVKHVGVGLACFAATAADFASFERRFLREVASLWAARRRPSSSVGGVADKLEKSD